MIIRTEDLKEICAKILNSVDSQEHSLLTETLELKSIGTVFCVSVTNREYFVRVKLDLKEEIDIHATINANVFLKLISQITTDTIELTTNDKFLFIRGNGEYKLSLIFDGEKLLELPEIEILNVTNSFVIDSEILNSILQYNTKEITKTNVNSKPIHRMYYIDREGAITFTTGACINKFSLPEDIKILLNQKVVKLFKLFKSGNVNFTLGYDQIDDDAIQTKVKFENDDVTITAIIARNSENNFAVNSVPVSAIRRRADDIYPYSVNINKHNLIQAINRLLIFLPSNVKPLSKFEFSSDEVVIYDVNDVNKEYLYYNNDKTNITEKYTAFININDLKLTLDNCPDVYVTLSFGNHQAFVVSKGNIVNVIPENT